MPKGFPIRATRVAWAAGLFEGEGTIAFAKTSRSVTLALAMIDQDVVERFARIVSCGTVRPRTTTHKTQWIWTVTNAMFVHRLLRQFAPHLGTRRAARATQALDRLATIQPRGYHRLGENSFRRK